MENSGRKMNTAKKNEEGFRTRYLSPTTLK